MNILAKYKHIFGKILFALFLAIVLVLSVRGLPGNPTPENLNTTKWKDSGPFELSPERGRFALLYALVENHSFHLPPAVAQFTAPDVGYTNGSYVTIFAPSVSFLAIPGYILGKYYGAAQFGAYLFLAIFALFNVFFIRSIAIRLGAHPLAGAIAGIVFLFATPSYAYAVTMYEHHVSTFLILLAAYLLMRFKSAWSLLAIWILYAFAFTVDYPNLFLMLPIAVTAFFRSGVLKKIQRKVTLSISLPKLLSVLGVILPLAFLLWVNQQSYNNPMQLSGTIPRVMEVKSNGSPLLMEEFYREKLKKVVQTSTQQPTETILNFFKPRNMLNGVYILLFSPDRGVIFYTPIILLGVLGMYFASKKSKPYLAMMLGIIGFDLVLYAMWGDPYGGWAFGARYLIPAYAILAIYIALLLTYFGRNKFFLLFFFVIFSYSIAVNTLGAVTSNSNPPKVEAESLSALSGHKESYTYERNINDLNGNLSKSYVFEAYAGNSVSAWNYYIFLTVFIEVVSALLIVVYQNSIKNYIYKGGKHAV